MSAMAAPVLSLTDQKKALSGKIKKKKIIKNVLGLPTSVKIESPVIDKKEAEKLGNVLRRLLPSARIPNLEIKKNEEKEVTPEMEGAIQQAKVKRKELSLGVNDLNRSIRKNLISAALLASDISPRFLVQHLNLLCIHNKIPFLHVPDLRNITQSSLGFPCIALGFRKNSNCFTEVILTIKTIAETKKVDIVSKKVTESESENNELVEQEESHESCNEDSVKSECNTPFQFLYRNSSKERVFVPENESICKPPPKRSETDFISIGADSNESEEKIDSPLKGISDNVTRKKKKKEVTGFQVLNLKQQDDTSSSEEEYVLPKKKLKKGWVIDKAGEKHNFKYSPANVIKVHSNPDRKKKKNDYLMK